MFNVNRRHKIRFKTKTDFDIIVRNIDESYCCSVYDISFGEIGLKITDTSNFALGDLISIKFIDIDKTIIKSKIIRITKYKIGIIFDENEKNNSIIFEFFTKYMKDYLTV